MGVMNIADSVQLYVETQNWPYNGASQASAAYQSVTSTATQTINGANVTNTWHKGVDVVVNFTQIAATCTVALNLQTLDPASGNYATIARCSLDSVTTGNINSPYIWSVYPNIVSTVGVQAGQGNTFYTSGIIPRTMRVQASITATASLSDAAISYTMALTKHL